jgi:hypothetical protein
MDAGPTPLAVHQAVGPAQRRVRLRHVWAVRTTLKRAGQIRPAAGPHQARPQLVTAPWPAPLHLREDVRSHLLDQGARAIRRALAVTRCSHRSAASQTRPTPASRLGYASRILASDSAWLGNRTNNRTL